MNVAKYIDHTMLNPDATKNQIKKLCDEAKKYKFASVCVNPYYVKYASEELRGTDIDITCVVGFPLGSNLSQIKKFETQEAINCGADEIDMVLNISALKNNEIDIVKKDIDLVIEAANGKVVKVIIETCLLTKKEKILACEIIKECGADFAKTSTGFSSGGATLDDVKLMKEIVGSNIGIKASGGIRTLEDVKKFIKAGASRIGASKSVSIINEI